MKSSIWGVLSAAALVFGIAALAPGREVQAGIAQAPLTLGGSVKPNLMLVIDNSGSMDGEGLYTTNDGALWWNTDSRSFWGAKTGSGGKAGLHFNDTGSSDKTWKKYTYLFPISDRILGDSEHDHFAVPPTDEFAFARSPDYNGQYYNPDAIYKPWPNAGGYVFAAASASAAKSDPTKAGTPTLNLTGDVTLSFRLHPGMRKPDGTVMRTSELTNAGPLVGRNYDFTFKAAVYYRQVTSSAGYEVDGRNYNCDKPDPAAYTAFAANPGGARFPGSVQTLAPDGVCLSRHAIAAGTAEMQNFANWFQYHRRRHLALRAGMGEAFNDIGGIRAGGTPINNRPSKVTMYDFDLNRDNIYKWFYEIRGTSGGTPNREALKFAGDQFNSNLDIVQHVCQKNFVLQFTDGFSYPASFSDVGNADAGKGAPYQDAYSNTIADIAMKYYMRVRTDLEGGKVPVPAECKDATHDASLDCNRDPHVNHYGVTLGAQGNIFGVTHGNVADAYKTPPNWIDPVTTRNPVQVDDLYHASVNGRGEMLNAKSSTELTAKLREALSSIMANTRGSGSRTASSSTRAGGGNLLFQARFDAAQWTGDLFANQINADGTIGALQWSAVTAMPAHATRNVYFRDAAGARQDFKWDQLSDAQKAAFNRDPGSTQTDNAGERRVRWLRGDLSAQTAAGGIKLRDRASALGDIVNSSPRYVATENYGYDRLPAGSAGRDSYQAFRFGKSDRKPMIYVGANDGMLHAFDAKTGIEQWAFIPSEFLQSDATQPVPALSQLTSRGYGHHYFVDGQPVTGDVYFDAAWHSVLVTPMGAGGRSIVAVDVTDPVGTGAPKVLWEFTDPDLGHVTGQPTIQRMANGKWAAIFGSGYGLDKSAKLFVVDIETGTLLSKIDTDPAFTAGSANANGLSAPYAVDSNGDTIIDMVYAGDLWGNLWRFDVDDKLATQWGVHHTKGTAPAPLISTCAGGDAASIYGCTTGRQPITARPVVGRGPNGALAVYFGTGKFFEDGDNSYSGTGPVQSFYGVHDDGSKTSVAGRSTLLKQSILSEVKLDSGSYRVTSNNELKAEKGWYIDLNHPSFNGERAISDALLEGGRIKFTTLIPGDACSGGSDGWFMLLDARDGSRFESPVLDVNGDGLFTESTGSTPGDTVLIDGVQVAVSGVGSTVGGAMTPTVVIKPDGASQVNIIPGMEGGTQGVSEQRAVPRGRASWRQFWP